MQSRTFKLLTNQRYNWKYLDESKVLQYFKLFCILSILSSIHKAEIMEMSIDSVLYMTKFYR